MTWPQVDLAQAKPSTYTTPSAHEDGKNVQGRPVSPRDSSSSTEHPPPSTEKDQESTTGSVADREDLGKAVGLVKKAALLFNRQVNFEIDGDTERIVIKVLDTETDKVVKEIPPEEVLRFVKRFHEALGLLVDERR